MDLNNKKVCTITNIIKSVVKIDQEIKMDKKISEYNIDSLAYIQIIVRLEDEFNIEFDDEMLDLSSIQTVNELVNYVLNKSKV